MKFLEVNPFVRTALNIKILPFLKNTVSLDSRLFYVVDGNGTAYINNEPYQFEKGSLMLWQGGTKYRFESNNAITLKVINFDYTTENSTQTKSLKTIVDEGQEIKVNQIKFLDVEILNKPIFIKNASYLSNVITALNDTINENNYQTEFTHEKQSTHFKKCLISIIESVYNENSGIDSHRLNVIVNFIKENYANDISNEDLAKLVGYHPYYLNRLFNQRFGVTLHQYLINYRLKCVENLLISTDKQISDIAYETGFSSTISLTVNFKNKHNVTPTEYRKTFRNFY